MSALSLQCSERSRRADEAQREVDDRYRAAWMEQHVGSEFDGVISGVTSFGLFIELDESKVNGLVHVTQLPNDRSEEHTSELQSLMRTSYAVLCLHKNTTQ